MNTLTELRDKAKSLGVEIKIGTTSTKKLYPKTFHFKVDNPLINWQIELITDAIEAARDSNLPAFYIYPKGLRIVK